MKRTEYAIILLSIALIVALLIIVAMLYVNKKTTCRFPQNNIFIQNQSTIGRYKELMKIWEHFENDMEFCQLCHSLMDTNSNIQDNNHGNKQLKIAFQKLDDYVRSHTNMPFIRLTLIYTDGIVFYDSVLSLDRIYFMDKSNNLPLPVSMYTLSSPLKNHNVLPEIANSIIVNDATDTCLSNVHPVYRKLMQDGFGFYERMSSSLDKPYCYVSRFLPLPYPFTKNFKDGCTLRIGMEITNGLNKKASLQPNIF